MTGITIHDMPTAEDIAESQIPATTLIENLYEVAEHLSYTPEERSVYISAFTAGMLLGSQRPEQILAFFQEIAPSDHVNILPMYQRIVDKVYSK